MLTPASYGIGTLRELSHAYKLSLFYDLCKTWCLVGPGESKTLESRLSPMIDRFPKQKPGTEEVMGVFFMDCRDESVDAVFVKQPLSPEFKF